MQKIAALFVVAFSFPAFAQSGTPAKPVVDPNHKAGELTESQRLRMINVNLAEYAFQADVRNAKSEAAVAAQKATMLDKELQEHIGKLEEERTRIKAEIEAQNPGYHWHDAEKPGDPEGLVKDPDSKSQSAKK